MTPVSEAVERVQRELDLGGPHALVAMVQTRDLRATLAEIARLSEQVREAREALVYYSKAEAYGRRIILNVEVMYDRGKKARQAIANIKALMGEAG